jgi:hypothetical protein
MFMGIIIYSIHYIISRIFDSYNLLPVRWYIGDFLALIVCVPLFVNLQIILGLKKNKTLTFEIIFYFIIFTLLYEIILPLKNNKLTADLYDCIAYALGGLFLYITQNFLFIRNIFKKYICNTCADKNKAEKIAV